MGARNVQKLTDADAELDAQAIELDETDQGSELQSYFDKFGDDDDGGIEVYEIDRSAGASFLFPFRPGEFTPTALLQHLATEYGAGTYRLLGRSGNGQLLFKRHVKVGRIKARSFPGRDSMPSSSSQPSASSIDPALKQILENQQRMLEQLIASNQTKEKSPLELLQEISAYKELLAPEKKQTDVTELLGVVRAVLDFKNEIGGDESEGNVLTMALKQFGPTIAKAVDALQRMPHQNQLPAPSHDFVRTVGEQPNQPGPTGPARALAPFVPQILMAARAGMVPAHVVKVALPKIRELPAPQIDELYEWLDDTNAAAKLIELEPQLSPFAGWLDQCIDLLVATLRQWVSRPETGAQPQPDEAPGSFDGAPEPAGDIVRTVPD